MSALGNRQMLRYHPTIGQTFIPNLRARAEHEGGGYLVASNAAGFRSDQEFEPRKPDGLFRVLVFGDSFVAGDGVSNRHRFSDLLQERVEGLQVYNFGLSGTGQDQQYLAYREFASEIEHDLLVIATNVENIARIVARYMKFATGDGTSYRLFERPYFELRPNGELELHNIPVPQDPIDPATLPDQAGVYPAGPPERRRLRALAYRLGPRVTFLARRLANRDPVSAYRRADDPGWRLLRAILNCWTSESPVPTVIFPIPLYHHVEELASPAGYQARFAELHRPPRVTVHDPLPILQSYSMEERRAFRFEHDPHPTRAGHEALASALEPLLRAQIAAVQQSPGRTVPTP